MTVHGGPRWSRRGFLTRLGAVGGAGAVLGAMEALGWAADAHAQRVAFQVPRRSDFALQGRPDHEVRVLILGAGVAGLAAAYELEKAGYRCEVIEARERSGGRSWTVRRGTRTVELDGTEQTSEFTGGQWMNAGPARIPQHHTTLDYCRELGVAIEPFVNANAQGWYFHDGRLGGSGPLAGQPVRHRATKADHLGYVSELLAKAIDRGALEAELSAEDAAAMVDFLRGLGALGPGDRYVGGSRRGWAVPPGAGDVEGELDDPYDLSDLLAAGFGYQFGFELDWDQAMMMFHPVGGMDALPRALATALRGRIRYSCEVRELRTTSEGVEVVFADPRGRSRLIRADHCICTLPPTILRRLHHDFEDEVTSALAGLRTLPVAKLGLEYAERFWETQEQLYGGITWTDLDIGTIWYPSTGYLSERGVVIGYYNFAGDAESYGSLAPQERVARAVETGRRVHGDAYADVEAAFSVHWDRTPYSEGGWVEWGGPRGAAYDTLLRPAGNIWFAGDHLSQVTAWQHGALESARYTVGALHERVLSD